MDSYVRVKWHNWFDHKVKQIASRSFIDDNYMKLKSSTEVVMFLCSEKYTWDYENLPNKFYSKIERSMNNFDTLTTILLLLNKDLYQKIEDLLLKKIAKHKDNKLNITKLFKKIYELSNKEEEEINKIIDSYCTIENITSNIKDKTSNLLESSNWEDPQVEIEYTPYQICCNESTLTSIEDLNLLVSLSDTFWILESKYLRIKDDFYLLMLENNKEFILNNIFIKKSKTYMSDELLEMFKSYVYLESKMLKWTKISWLVTWMEGNDINKENFIKEYVINPWKLSVLKSGLMWVTRYSLSLI